MDPDAAHREGKPLHDLDKEDENRMLRYIFKYLRAGQLQAGKELAQKLGYHWISAALEGWTLHYDPRVSEDISDDITGDLGEGNSRRDLWKYVCWQMSKATDISSYEKALFGALSGNVSSVLPHCPRWSDKLWAFFR